MAEEQELKVVVSMVDKITSNLNSVEKNMKDFGDSAKKVGLAFTAVGATIGAAFVASVKEAGEFESTMSNISTLISGDSTEAVKELSDGILEMTSRVPKSADELGAAAYDVVSAGISGTADQLNVLEQSGELAVAGLGDTAGAVDIMTSAINAFNLPASEANDISDILFKTVKNGKTTVDEMAQAFGASAPVVAGAGVSLEEFSAATAALTTTGQPASQAQNSLRQSVVSLQKPTADMAELLEKVGYESGAAALEQDGLTTVMAKVEEAADGDTEALSKAWGSVEAFGAAAALTGPVAEAFTSTMDDMVNGANAVDEAFAKQNETFEASWQLLKNEVNKVMIKLGSEILPPLTDAIKTVTEKVGSWVDANPELVETIAKITAGVGLASTAIGALLLLLSTLPTIIGTVSSALTLATGPVGLVIAAITLLIAAGVLLYQNWETIKERVNQFIDKHDGLREAIEMGIETIKKIANTIKEKFVIAFEELMTAMEPHKDELEKIALILGGVLLVSIGSVVIALATIAAAFTALLYVGLKVTTWVLEAKTWFEEFAGSIKDNISGAVDSVSNSLASIRDSFVNVFSSLGDTVQYYINNVWGIVSGAIDNIINAVWNIPTAFSDAFGSAVQKAKDKLTSIDIPGIPGFAEGVNNFKGGLAVVGEKGPELVNLPRGSDVIPNDQISSVLPQGQTSNINNSRSLNVTNNIYGGLVTDKQLEANNNSIAATYAVL